MKLLLRGVEMIRLRVSVAGGTRRAQRRNLITLRAYLALKDLRRRTNSRMPTKFVKNAKTRNLVAVVVAALVVAVAVVAAAMAVVEAVAEAAAEAAAKAAVEAAAVEAVEADEVVAAEVVVENNNVLDVYIKPLEKSSLCGGLLSIFNHSRRHADAHGPRRDVSRDDGTDPNHRMVTNAHAIRHRYIRPDPAIAPNCNPL